MVNPTKILSALAEPTRLKAMVILWDGREHCVCEFMEAFKKSQSCLSRHMAKLKAAGLIVDRRDGQWMRYKLDPLMPHAVKTLVKAVLALHKTYE
ncbi:MAG: ArsR/SmtB family transcription factor [Bdellovibrionales bacterium]